MSGVGPVGRAAWAALGGDPDALDSVLPLDPPARLASRFDVVGLAGDSVALAALAVHEAVVSRGLARALPPVRISGDRLCTSLRSDRCLRIDGAPARPWAPLSGFFRTGDGWVRTHGNYPHHASRLRALLGLTEQASPDQTHEAFRRRSAQGLEDDAAACGAIAVPVRTPDEWHAHPQAQAVARGPLVDVRPLEKAPVRRWGPAARPLDGIRVLDLTRVIAGPVAGRDLAFAGADVLRIDSPRLPELPWQHLDTGQGKRSTLLDLTDTRDRAVFEDLLSSADVVLSGYRPGSLAALGLSPEALSARRPGLVVGQVSAWGPTGPWRSRRGFDSIVQAATGIAVVESDDGATPGALPAQALDHSAGHLLAAGVVHALVARQETGRGASVSVSLARVAHELMTTGIAPRRRSDSGPTWTTQTMRTADGELTTAAPVLGYVGAPDGYPEIGGAWAADPPAWRTGADRPPGDSQRPPVTSPRPSRRS